MENCTLLTDELRDLYDAENQIVKALPKVVHAVIYGELSARVTSARESNTFVDDAEGAGVPSRD